MKPTDWQCLQCSALMYEDDSGDALCPCCTTTLLQEENRKLRAVVKTSIPYMEVMADIADFDDDIEALNKWLNSACQCLKEIDENKDQS